MTKDEGLKESLLGLSFESESEELAALEAAPWSDSLRAFLQPALNAGNLFTHSNRLVDARVSTTVAAGYAEHGDTSAKAAGLSQLVDQQGNAADSQKFKRLFAEYHLNGHTTNLAEAILQGRPAGKKLAGGIDPRQRVVNGTDPLDKVLLMPTAEASGYVALLPKTPGYLYPALLAGAKAVGFAYVRCELDELQEKQEKEAQKTSQIPKFLGIRLRARCAKLSKAQNFSYQLNKIAGQIVQPLFLPPGLVIPQPRRWAFIASRWVDEGRLPIGLLTPVLRSALKESGFFAAIAHERHRHETEEDSNLINNKGVREAYRLLGQVSGQAFRETLSQLPIKKEAETVLTQRDAMLKSRESDAEPWYKDIENRIFLLIPDRYRLDDARELFRKGFYLHDNDVTREVGKARSSSRPDHASQSDEGSYLVIHLSATDVDAGSNGVSIGVPAITAIHGMLHAVVERRLGLTMKKFLPTFSRIELNDTLARHSTSRVALWDKDIKKALAGTLVLQPGDLSLGMGAAAMNGRSAVSVKAVDHGKAITPPFNNDVKASVLMSVVVELRHSVDAQLGAELVSELNKGMSSASLAGGPINWSRATIRNEIPRLKGFALQRVENESDENSFELLFRSVAFAGREYLGEYPIGAVQTGYEALAPAGKVSRKGETWEALHVESLYSLFRFVRADNRDRQWFRLRSQTSSPNLFTLC